MMNRFFTAAIALTLVFTLAASLAGCGLFGNADESTTLEDTTLEETQSVVEVIEMTQYTEQLTQLSTTTMPTTTAPTTTRAATTTTRAPADTSAASAQTEAPDTTAAQDTTTAAKPNGSGSLKSAVTSPMNSGNYTMSVGVTNDSSDVATKYKSGSNVSYRVAFPGDGFDCYVFKEDGNYYLTGLDKGEKKYCKLTKEQYNSLSSSIEKAFSYNFGALTYESSSIELFNGSLHTKEVYDRADGTKTNLWFKNGSLVAVLDNAQNASAGDAVNISVSSGSSGGMYSLPSDYAEDTEQNIATACIPLIQMVCS